MDLTTLSAFAPTIATATTDKPGRPQKRRLPVLCLRLLAGVASLGKSPVRCHEPRQHWCNQLDWITDRLTALAREDLGVDDEVPVNGCWQFNGDLDRFVVVESAQSKLCHLFIPHKVRARDRGSRSLSPEIPDGSSTLAGC